MEKQFCKHYSGVLVSADGKTNMKSEHLDGYGYRRISYLGKGYSVHRLVAEVFLNNNQPIPKGYHVHHINGNKLDNRAENLQILTKEEHGRLHGVNGGKSKCRPPLTDEERKTMLERLEKVANGEKYDYSIIKSRRIFA